MNTIVQYPTITNPNALHTVEELRSELHIANKAVLSLTETLASEQGVLHWFKEHLASLVELHAQGRQGDVLTILDELLFERNQCAAMLRREH